MKGHPRNRHASERGKSSKWAIMRGKRLCFYLISSSGRGRKNRKNSTKQKRGRQGRKKRTLRKLGMVGKKKESSLPQEKSSHVLLAEKKRKSLLLQREKRGEERYVDRPLTRGGRIFAV